jgi:hypothetical protein
MLELTIIRASGPAPLRFDVRRMVNAGYVGRDISATKAHIKELEKEGVPPPPSIPILFPILRGNITTEGRIEVVGDKTSGEVEFVLLLAGDSICVGVGSDHTDRELEKQSILLSKQVCPNVLSSEVWDYRDVEDHWDDLVLQSWVIPGSGKDEILYQEAPLKVILSAPDLIELVKSRFSDEDHDGLAIFSGTIPTVMGEMVYGSHFRCALTDPHVNRALTCAYEVVKLDYLSQDGDSAPKHRE